MLLKSIKLIFRVLFGAPIYFIAKVFPKKKGLSVIGSNLGLHFADNPKYFYIHHYTSSKAKQEKNLIWISRKKQIVEKLNSLGLPAEHLFTIKGIFTILRAERAFISHQLVDISGPLLGGAKIVQLWHAMALRKVGFNGDWNTNSFNGKIKNFISKWVPYEYYMKCDFLLAPCKEAKTHSIEPFSKSFRNGKIEENIFLARQPRMRAFDSDFVLSRDFFPENEMLIDMARKYDKIVSWLPTQRRQFGKTILDVIKESKLDLTELNTFCRSNNILFVIKAHFLDFEEVKNIVENKDFIFVYPYADPYPLLRYTNVLVTDYSSVFFDFLCVNRPIIFMSYDLIEYQAAAKFYYDYEDLQIGPICKTWIEVLVHLKNISKRSREYQNLREEALERFNFVTDYKIEIPYEA